VKENEIADELVSIRSIMERSSKFISLSGLSGILAGVYALIGSTVAFFIISDHIITPFSDLGSFFTALINFEQILISLSVIALIVLLASVTTAFILSRRKARKNGQSVWGAASRALLFNMAVPLVSGGLLIIIMALHGYFVMIAAVSLIFYGLSLVSAGNFTFKDVRYLGFSEIALGLIAACIPGYGLLIWAIGFGVLHVVYGSIMHFKYDR
jgi:hypothetical protein